MKRLLLSLMLLACAAAVSAQNPIGKTLAEAQIEYDRAVAKQKLAIDEIKSEERRITEAAKQRLDASYEELNEEKERTKLVIEEQKRKVASAKQRLADANTRYKQESTRTK